MKIKLCTLLFLTCTISAFAGLRSKSVMRQIAFEQLLPKTRAAAGAQTDNKTLKELYVSSELSVFGLDRAGFVVVSADDNCQPVLAYSKSTAFNPGNMPEGLRWWLQAMEESLSAQAKKGIRQQAPTQTFTPIDNFLTAQWGQEKPYNLLCPQVEGKQPPSGCVATAMSQIMYFHKYPAQGKGTGRYSIGTSSKMSEKIEGIYQWDLMRDVYKNAKTSDEEKNAVATLMRDCGYGCYMNYASGGSGAYVSDCARSLIDNFSYNPGTLRLLSRTYYGAEEWLQLMHDELSQGRPILYSGADKDHGGHAFIACGMDEKGLLYINWGWDGSADGFYDVRSLNPTGILGTSYPYAFIEHQEALLGIMPPTTEEPAEEAFSISLKDVFSVKKIGNSYLQLSSATFYNTGFRNFKGDVGFYFVSADGDASKNIFVSAYNNAEGDAIAPGYGAMTKSTLHSVSKLPAGEYVLYMAAKVAGSERTELVRVPGGLYAISVVKTAEGQMQVGEGSLVDAIDTVRLDDKVSSAAATTRVFDTNGRLIYSCPTPQFNLWNIPARGVLVVTQGEKAYKIVR